MGKTLVIAEKPSVGRDYARVLGCREKGEGFLSSENYIVSWAVGHLIELCEPEKYDPKYKKWNYPDLPIIPQQMKLQTIRKTSSQFQVLKKLMNSPEVDRIICGTDSGREGELIFRYIYQVAKCSKPFDRLWVSSMTEEAISKGFREVKDGHQYDSLYQSARCRSEADWLVGINGSRAFSIRYNALLSIGRVQTPTLGIIVNRQDEIDRFVPEDYYEIQLTHQKDEAPETFDSRFFRLEDDGKTKNTRMTSKEEANEILSRALSVSKAEVLQVDKTPKKQLPPLLYDLTELQRDGNRRYGFSANKVLNIAQSLYENHKLLTYPRTDSRYLPSDQKENVRKTLHAINIPEFHQALKEIPVGENGSLRFNSRIIDDSKITDHHAIIPTLKKPDLSKLSQDERKIYELVAMRLIEVFYLPYEYDSIEVILGVGDGENRDRYLARGKVVRELGFMKLHQKENQSGKKKKSQTEEEGELPPLSQGETVKIKNGKVEEKKTQPPKPFTEATLLTAMEYAGRYVEEEVREQMEKLSLGTPATRAAIIERLIYVGYVVRKGKVLLPTEKGKKLIRIVPQELKSPEMTGRWEKALDKIYQGGMDPDRFMGSIERYVRYIVTSAQNDAGIRFEEEEKGKGTRKKTSADRSLTFGKCPLCGGDVRKNSKAYFCSNWKEKDCKFTIWISSLDRYGASLTDEMMGTMLSGQKLPIPMTMPQTAEKGTGEVYISKEGHIEIQNFQKEKEA